MTAKTLIDETFDDEDAGPHSFRTVLEIGEDDVDVTVTYEIDQTTLGDVDHRPGGRRARIVSVSSKTEDLFDKLSQDQFYDLEERASEDMRYRA